MSPGPGRYNVRKSFESSLDLTTKVSFPHAARDMKYGNVVPGPGTYAPETADMSVRKKSPRAIFSKQLRLTDIKSNTPGYVYHPTDKLTKPASPSAAFAKAKRDVENKSEVPAANLYNPNFDSIHTTAPKAVLYLTS